MIKKERMKGFIAGITLATVLMSTTVFAQTYKKNLIAVYNDIKIVIDGNKLIPNDGNGNRVDPFIVEGTTYLPVRAVAEALGKSVRWNGSAKEVIIEDEESISYRVKDYIENQQGDLSRAESYIWTDTHLDNLSDETIENLYNDFLNSGGSEYSIREFAGYITVNAPIYPKWKEAYERETAAFYEVDIIRYEYVGDGMYASYVEGEDGNEYVFQYISAISGFCHA